MRGSWGCQTYLDYCQVAMLPDCQNTNLCLQSLAQKDKCKHLKDMFQPPDNTLIIGTPRSCNLTPHITHF